MTEPAIPSSEALLAAVRRFTRASLGSNKTISSGELSQAEWHLLWLLKHWPESSGAQPSQIAQRMRVTAGNVAQQLRHLEQLKLVQRTSAESDRRRVLVTLTRHGEKYLSQIRNEILQHFEQLITHIGPKQTKQFTNLLLSTAEFLEQLETSQC